MMFNECSYTSGLGSLGGPVAPPTVPLWQQLGFQDKGTWKRAGRPTTSDGGGMTILPPPGGYGGGGVDGSIDPATGQPVAGASKSSGGIGDLLSSIPSSYLLIGGVIIVLMVLKK